MNIIIDIILIIIWLLWVIILRIDLKKWHIDSVNIIRVKSILYWLSIFILTYFTLDLIGKLL